MVRPIAPTIGDHAGQRTKGSLAALVQDQREWLGMAGWGARCWCGQLWLLSLVSAEHMRVGIDLSMHLHGISDSWVDPAGAKMLHFVYGDGTRLPFPDGTFDLVYSNEFVSHVSSMDTTIIEQIRVLKKGALFVAMDANVLNPITSWTCFSSATYGHSVSTRRGGMQWKLHREAAGALL